MPTDRLDTRGGGDDPVRIAPQLGGPGKGPPTRLIRVAIAAVAAVAIVSAAGFFSTERSAPDKPVTLAVSKLSPGYGPASFEEALAEADRKVAIAEGRLSHAPDEWLRSEYLALALMARHRLGGDASDLSRSGELLDAGMRLAPEPSGPSLSQALLALKNHRLDAAEQSLARFDRTVAPSPRDRAEAAALHGDIAFQKGNLKGAAEYYREAARISPSVGVASRNANVALWSGDIANAVAIAEDAISDGRHQAADLAASALLLANISYAQGDLARADEWINAAREAFPGYWLADAYAAQQVAATGNRSRGIGMLEKLAQRTQEPEVVDVLAGFLHAEGRGADARRWIKQADRLWAEKLALSRDAYRLHAAEHYLDFGDAERALALSSEEIAARPFGEAIEVHASALTATGHPGEALAWLDRAEAAGWRSVSLDLARSEALTALGRKPEAERYVRRARAINPRAMEPERKLIRLGHF